jgi:hypothetical protein
MPPGSDWRSSAIYEYLYDLDASELAWEFLRRNPDYQRDYCTSPRPELVADDGAEWSARTWGLRFRDRSGIALGSGLPCLVAAP